MGGVRQKYTSAFEAGAITGCPAGGQGYSVGYSPPSAYVDARIDWARDAATNGFGRRRARRADTCQAGGF